MLSKITPKEVPTSFARPTIAKRIVEIFQMVKEHNAENPDDLIDVKDGFHQIDAIPVNKGTMLVFH